MICSNSDMSLNVGLLKNKICPTNLISSLDRVRSLVRRGNATDKACLDFRKTCDHVLWCPHGKMKIRELGESWIGRLMDDGTLAGKPWALLWTPLLHVLTWDLDSLNTEGGKTLRNQALKGFICRLAGGHTSWVKMKEVYHEPWAPRGWSVWYRCGEDQGLFLPLNHSQFG